MDLIKLDITKHDLNKISELIYETDAETFNFYFQNKEKASKKILELVKRDNNTLGFQNIYVITENNENNILGILVAVKSNQTSLINDFRANFKALNLWDALKFSIFNLVDLLILAKLEDNDLYLASVAVDDSCRGKGIGTLILEKSLELARDMGCKRVVLDVDLKNEGALRLYERFGFKIFNKKSIMWFGGEKGVYNMEYNL
ncbi:MAG TPA: GNAT family N-acetyltransferase [Methanobacterium sp.]|nr:GNAT family N-acetyltransferase [Methanobacterium sp.]